MSVNDSKHQVIQALLAQKQTVSFAESCTGGALSASITEESGISAIYNGSVVSYANDAKVELLGVGRESLNQFGAVSEIVAQEMAQGVRRRFHTDWGVSVTGIAGPTGGSLEKPVGTVWIAVAGCKLATLLAQDSKSSVGRNDPSLDLAEFVEARKFFFKGDRKQIQKQSVEAALGLLLNVMKSAASSEQKENV